VLCLDDSKNKNAYRYSASGWDGGTKRKTSVLEAGRVQNSLAEGPKSEDVRISHFPGQVGGESPEEANSCFLPILFPRVR